MKHIRIIGLSLIFLFCITACTQSVSEGGADYQEKPKQELHQYISIDGEAVTFVCNTKPSDSKAHLSYQWYEFSGNDKILIDGATDSSYTSAPLSEPGIKNYCCIVTEKLGENTENQTIIYSVAWTGLPVLYLNTTRGANYINQKEYTPVSFELYYVDGTEPYIIELDETAEEPACSIKGRGNSSWSAPKKGYNIKIEEKPGLFGLCPAKKWCIIPNYMDASLIKNTFVSYLGREIFKKYWNPTIQNIDVVMDGEYIGNYAFAERVSLTRDKNYDTNGIARVAVQDISDCTDKKIKKGDYVDKNGDGIVDLRDGGFILEVDRWKDADFVFTTKKGAEFVLKDPDEVSEEIQELVKNIVQTAENVLYSADYKNESEGWRKYIDEDDLVDWFLVHEFTKSRDCNFWTSVYMVYDPSDQKLHFGPNWDFDLSMTSTKPEGWKLNDSLWISRIISDEEFMQNVKHRWDETQAALLAAINGNAEDASIQGFADKIEVSANFDRMRWSNSFYIMENFLSEEDDKEEYMDVIADLKNWCNNRYNWLNTEFQ